MLGLPVTDSEVSYLTAKKNPQLRIFKTPIPFNENRAEKIIFTLRVEDKNLSRLSEASSIEEILK